MRRDELAHDRRGRPPPSQGATGAACVTGDPGGVRDLLHTAPQAEQCLAEQTARSQQTAIVDARLTGISRRAEFSIAGGAPNTDKSAIARPEGEGHSGDWMNLDLQKPGVIARTDVWLNTC